MKQFWEIKMEISIIILSHEFCNREIISFSVIFNLVISSKLSVSRKKNYLYFIRELQMMKRLSFSESILAMNTK